jgi:hypothetical protein
MSQRSPVPLSSRHSTIPYSTLQNCAIYETSLNVIMADIWKQINKNPSFSLYSIDVTEYTKTSMARSLDGMQLYRFKRIIISVCEKPCFWEYCFCGSIMMSALPLRGRVGTPVLFCKLCYYTACASWCAIRWTHVVMHVTEQLYAFVFRRIRKHSNERLPTPFLPQFYSKLWAKLWEFRRVMNIFYRECVVCTVVNVSGCLLQILGLLRSYRWPGLRHKPA